MWRNLIAFPLLVLVVILQSAVISRIPLLAGYADLMLVVLAAWALQIQVRTAWHWAVLGGIFVSFVSAMPWPVILIGYLVVVLMAQLLQQRVWQAPLLAMFSVTFVGTLFMNVLSLVVLQITGTSLPLANTFGLLTLPSVLLNLLFAIPVFAMMRDLAQWVYPQEAVE